MTMTTHDGGASASFTATIIGGVMAAIGGLSTTEIMAIMGMILAAAGFIVNTWAVWRRDMREQKLFEIRARRGSDDEVT